MKGDLEHYGKWKLVSNGPDRVYNDANVPQGPWNLNFGVLLGSDVPYDATNGTVSFGNIIRTQKHVDGLPPRT